VTAVFWDSSGGGYEELVTVYDRSDWDKLYLGGMLLPGIASLEGGDVSRKIDIKNAKGQDGATITHNGYEPAKPSFKLTLAGPAQWSLYEQILPLIAPKLGKPPSAPLRCEHPALAVHGIDQVLVEKVSLLKAGQVPGTKEVTISLVQWVPQPKKAKAMKKKAASSTEAFGPPTVKTQIEQDNETAYRAAHPGESGPPLPPKPSTYNAVPNPT
jgi:hypothetical protein